MTNELPQLDLVIIATRRPDLLERTIESFQVRILNGWNVSRVFCNIDPAFGSPEDERKCLSILSSRFENVTTRTPEAPSFGMAVKWAWKQPLAPVVLHMEDDWIVNEQVDCKRVRSLLQSYDAVRLAGNQRQARRSNRIYKEHVRRGWGPLKLKIGTRTFGTAPAFLKTGFARAISELLDPALDPEKQMLGGFNKVLEKYIRSRRVWQINSSTGGPLIKDIGREWREARGIEKQVSSGKSVWTTPSSPDHS